MYQEKVYCEDCDHEVPIEEAMVWNGAKDQWLCCKHAVQRDDFQIETRTEDRMDWMNHVSI